MPKEEISIKDTKEVTCSCGSTLFKQLASMREVPAALTGTQRIEYIPVSVMVCNKCEKVFERNQIIV